MTHEDAAATPIVQRLWRVRIPILDQGQVGSCTGEAGTYALGTDDGAGQGLVNALTAGGVVVAVDQAYAYGIYHNNTVIDGFDGVWEPDDTGSSGLATAQTLKSWGQVRSYAHCTTLRQVLAALQRGTVLLGTNWYDSMFEPNVDGEVTILPRAVIAGGHEYLAIGVDPDHKMIDCVQSWGPEWGLGGRFKMSYDTLERLLDEDGDAIVLDVARVPADPGPTPDPEPPIPAWFTKLQALVDEILDWLKTHVVRHG